MAGERKISSQATAHRALVVLDRYESDARRLTASMLDPVLYARAAQELEEIRSCCAGLPEVSVQWVELLIAHADLVHCLWRSTRPGSATTAADRQLQLDHLIACSRMLRAACLRIAAGQAQDPGS
ncbi:MAG: hypothetical protein JWP22_1892 [Ramlibacter sp.]|nr:hypothetical protein [Ramlibacter sp.]